MILEQLGSELGLTVHGNVRHSVSSLASIESAGPEQLAFVVGRKYTSALKASQAGAVILPATMLADAPGNALVSDDPYASYAKASWLLYPPDLIDPGIHATAIIHDDAKVSPTASIGPHAVVGQDSVVHDDVHVGAHSIIGRGVTIGVASKLFARVTVYDNVSLGDRCRIQSGAVIGSEGFGYAWSGSERSGSGWRQIQQVGGVQIGNDVHIGANTTIDCGAIEPTVIEDGVILDNQIQIAHNVFIGRNTAIAGCVGIAGSTHIGSHCQIGGACNIVGHLRIADQVIINAASLVTRSIDQRGRYGSGMPLQPENIWRRSFVNLGKLEELFRRVKRIERHTASCDKKTDVEQKTNGTS